MPTLTASDFDRIKSDITQTLDRHMGISPAKVSKILPIKNIQGKLYEVHILTHILKKLTVEEHCQIKLKNNGTFRLKQKGSKIDRNYPYFEVWRNDELIGEIFTDTEFTSLSSTLRKDGYQSSSDYHELDIVMFTPNQTERPLYNTVLLAIECKATTIEKSIFRELLGYRRELSILIPLDKTTIFNNWPNPTILADPASIYMCYSWDSNIRKYESNAKVYGIMIFHETM